MMHDQTGFVIFLNSLLQLLPQFRNILIGFF